VRGPSHAIHCMAWNIMPSLLGTQLCAILTVRKKKSVSDSDGLVDAGLMMGILRMLAMPAAATDAREQMSPITPTAQQIRTD